MQVSKEDIEVTKDEHEMVFVVKPAVPAFKVPDIDMYSSIDPTGPMIQED